MVRPSTLRFPGSFAISAFGFVDLESDPLPWLFWRRHELPDCPENDLNVFVVPSELGFNFFQFLFQLLLSGSHFPKPYKDTHNGNIYFDSSVAVKNRRKPQLNRLRVKRGEHGHTLFGKNIHIPGVLDF